MLATLLGDSVEAPAAQAADSGAHRRESVLHRGDGAGAVRRGRAGAQWRSEGDAALSQLRLPPTVQGILAARIDRQPGEHKQLLQTLAVIGRESSLALLRQVASQPGDQLERMLGELRAGEFIYEQPAATGVEYVFKHALTQEVAYNSLLDRAAQATARARRAGAGVDLRRSIWTII